MVFDAAFARDVLLPLNIAAYALSKDQKLSLPDGWQQTGVVTVDESMIDREAASGLAKTVISEDCNWGLVARKDASSVIAIRGTETEHQWLEDFRAIAQPVPHEQWWIHGGFDEVWRTLVTSLQKAWDTACLVNARVYITGHSLGAAIGLILGVHHPEAFTWTFAGPAVFSPVGGLPPAKNVVRVVNPSDLVPKVPVPPLFEHIGPELQVEGAPDRFDFALQHSLNTYAAGLAKLTRPDNSH